MTTSAALSTYHVSIDGQVRNMTFGAKADLSEVRRQIGVGFQDYRFVYFNPIEETKAVLNNESFESGKSLDDGFVLPGGIVLLANVSASNPSIFGTRTDLFRDRNMGVRVVRNRSHGRGLGRGGFEPLMLTNVSSADPRASVFADNVVVCQEGTPLQFEICSWGAAGFGFDVKSNTAVIADSLYITYRPEDYGSTRWASVRRYQDGNQTIQVSGSFDLGTAGSGLTVKTWRLTSYRWDGKTYSSNLAPPTLRLGAVADDLFGGDPEGDAFVPDEAVAMNFGTISDVREDGPDRPIGMVRLFLWPFKDKAAVNKTLNVLNSSRPETFPN